MRVFLDEIFDRRLKVLSYINNSKQPTSVKEVAKATQLANRTVSMIIKQFEQELNVPDNVFKVHYINQTIKSISANNLDLNSIGRTYLLQSTMYKVIKYIFLYDKLDVTRFCEAEFISPATFSRHRKKLKEILLACGLDLSRENRIIGEEIRIRNFFFLFFSNASNGWEFSHQEYQEIHHYFSEHFPEWDTMDDIKQLKFILIIYVSVVRSRRKNFAENDVLINLLEKHEHLESTTLLLDYFTSGKNKTIDQVWAETSATLFLLYKEHLSFEELELQSYKEYFSKEHFSFIPASEELTEKIITVFFDGNKSEEIYLNVRKEVDLFYLILDICFINSKIFYYIYDEENFYHADSLEKKIKEKLELIFQQLKIVPAGNSNYTTQEELLDYMYLVIYSLKIQFKVASYEPVKVFIQNTKNFVKEILQEKVNLFFGDRVECVESLTSQVDIIVTDVNLRNDEIQAYQVYVSTFSDFADISFLIEQIQHRVINNYDQRKMHLLK